MKYQIGDKVLIRSDLANNTAYGDDVFTGMIMCALCGKTVEIIGIRSGKYWVAGGVNMNFTDEMIERKVNEMTKDDLKVGHVVEMRNGNKLLVMPHEYGICLVDANGFWLELNEYSDEMLNDDGIHDIVRIYGFATNPSESGKAFTKFRPLLWERNELTEITAEEAYKIIAKDRGCPVENVRVMWKE
jgi:hypothetical protein